MRFQFVLVGAMLIGAPWFASAAERNDRADSLREIAASIGRVHGTASACREISPPRIKAMTDKLFGLIKAYAFNDEESASIQRVYNQRYIEGQRAVTDKQTDCAAADRDLTALELTVTSPPAAAPPGGFPTQARAATSASPPPAPAAPGPSPQSAPATPLATLPP